MISRECKKKNHGLREQNCRRLGLGRYSEQAVFSPDKIADSVSLPSAKKKKRRKEGRKERKKEKRDWEKSLTEKLPPPPPFDMHGTETWATTALVESQPTPLPASAC